MIEVRVRYANRYAMGTHGYSKTEPSDRAGTRKVHAGTRKGQKGTPGTRFYKKRTRVPAVPKPCTGGWFGALPLDHLTRRISHGLKKAPAAAGCITPRCTHSLKEQTDV